MKKLRAAGVRSSLQRVHRRSRLCTVALALIEQLRLLPDKTTFAKGITHPMYGRQYHNRTLSHGAILVSFIFKRAELCAAGYATIGPNIADKGSGYYHFES